MNTIDERVLKCFGNVFPEIRLDEIPRASTSSLAAWDSVAHVVLLTAISEEFGYDIGPEDFEHLVSYDLIVQYVADYNRDFVLGGSVLSDDSKHDRSPVMTERAN